MHGLQIMLALVAALAPPVPPVVQIERAPDRAGIQVHIAGVVRAPACSVERVLFDTPDYPRWFPSSQSVHVIAEQPNTILFEGRFRLPWPVGEVGETLWLRRHMEGASVVVAWAQQRGDFRRNQGRWTLTAIDRGHTLVSYDAVLQTRRWVPRWMLKIASRRQAPRMMRALEARAVECACTHVVGLR